MPDTVTLDRTIKKARVIDAAIPNIHSLHSIITEKLQKYTNLQEELNMACIVPLALTTTGIIRKITTRQLETA